jgi:hypothetical protein
MADEAPTSATIGDEVELAAVVAEEVPVFQLAMQPEAAMKKVKPELTAEQRQVENMKRTEHRRPLDQRKREAAAADERQRVAE